MKKRTPTLISFAAILCLNIVSIGFPETDEDDENGLYLSGGVDAAIFSDYISQGAELNSEGVFQPEVWLSFMGLGVSVWGNVDLTDSNFGVPQNALVDLEFKLEATTELGGGFYLSLLGSYYSLVEGDLSDEAGSAKDGFWGGGSIGFEFCGNEIPLLPF